MAVKTAKIYKELYNAPSTTLTEVIALPGATSISNVVVKVNKPNSVPMEQGTGAGKYTYTLNPLTGEVTVVISNVPYTKMSTAERQNLAQVISDGSGMDTCIYYGGYQSKAPYGQCPVQVNIAGGAFVYDYDVTVTYETNRAPTITLATSDSRTLYENDTYNLTGTYNDADSGNVLSVKYSVNNGEIRALTSAISDGIAKTFNRVLTYKNNKLYDGATVLTNSLAEGAQHVVKVWAEDDKGGKSQEQLRIFYVVANRAPLLTVNAFPATPDLLNTGSVKFGGTVSDPDGNAVKVEYKIRNGSFVEVYNGNGGSFEITVPLSSLNAGTNAISIRAVDSYGATTTRNLNVTKAGSSVPLKTGDKRYRITPPNGSAQGVLLWVQRESGDLVVSAEISMTAAGEAENFVPMTLNSTAFVNGSIEEDEFFFEGTEAKTNIVVRLKMTRTNPASTAGIILVNGVLS